MIEKDDIRLLESKARHQSIENIEKWGLQNKDILLLAMQEELGELTREYLQNNYEKNKKNISKEYNELYQLMALIYAYYIELEWNRYGFTKYRNKHEFYDKEVLK